eukprot:TRINITY_DN101019_c0_g1_i1.p1 TRINITY_DN101019_c0_g1~~TRINITY_DN101019_c0_g1_i1.p1  ORF type:complete len:369 (-),score=61.95 TRINITY_DN101019_c0_g1_i1:347-1381(-)
MAAAPEAKEPGGHNRLWTLFFVLSWFALNISMANVAKWLFMYGEICDGDRCHKYDYPLSMTAFDVCIGRFLSDIYLRIWLPDRPRLSLGQQLRQIAPLGACFALSIGMGNLSLKYIFPSFNQMIGASSPLITFLMAIATGKRYNMWTWLSMPIICGGLATCVTQEVNFHFFGALSCVGAAVLRGVKSIVQARLLSGESGQRKLDSVELLYYMSPYAALVLALFAFAMEGTSPVTLLAGSLFSPSATGVWRVVALLLLTALNAWFLSVANFLVTHHTSAVTLQVLGNVKTCLSILISVTIFRNAIQMSQCLGVVSCLLGVWLYSSRGKAIAAEKAQAAGEGKKQA